MTERQRLSDAAQRARILRRDYGLCVTCGSQLSIMAYQRAHIIPQRKHWLRRFGPRIIYHDHNMRATCQNDRCNNAVSLGNNVYLIDQYAGMLQALPDMMNWGEYVEAYQRLMDWLQEVTQCE